MTPPPTTTTWARSGISGTGDLGQQRSNAGPRKVASALSKRSMPQPWKSKSIGLVAAWMKPHSDQPYWLQSDWSRTRARSATVGVPK